MKLATLKNGTRDGRLVVVSRDLTRYTDASFLAPTMQAALDDWQRVVPASGGTGRIARPWRGAVGALPRERRAFAAAAGLSVGRRLGLCQPCRTGAQIARQRDAGQSSDRSTDLPGRLGFLPRPARSDRAWPTRPGASISRARSPSSPATCRWARARPRRRSRSAWSCWSTTSACARWRPANSPRVSASSSRSRLRRFRRSRSRRTSWAMPGMAASCSLPLNVDFNGKPFGRAKPAST